MDNLSLLDTAYSKWLQSLCESINNQIDSSRSDEQKIDWQRLIYEFIDTDSVNSTCEQCNGYYGRVFGSPLCATCHEFLFINQGAVALNEPKVDDGGKSDSDDSGNEDPDADPNEPSASVNMNLPPAAAAAGRNGNGAEGDQSLGQQLRRMQLHDRLSQQVHALSHYSMASHGCLPDDLFESHLPHELLYSILSMISDCDFALWSAARVNRRWRKLVLEMTTSKFWHGRVRARFAAHSALRTGTDDSHCWLSVFSRMVACTTCVPCQMSIEQGTSSGASLVARAERNNQLQHLLHPAQQLLVAPINIGDNAGAGQEAAAAGANPNPVLPVAGPGTRLCRLQNEIRNLHENTPDGIRTAPLDESYVKWWASIDGPVNTPYEGGTFHLVIEFPLQYPIRPPHVRFTSRILHPNVSAHGDIGMDLLNIPVWSAGLSTQMLLVCIRSMLGDPNPALAMRPSLARLYDSHRQVYLCLTQWHTHKYAMAL